MATAVDVEAPPGPDTPTTGYAPTAVDTPTAGVNRPVANGGGYSVTSVVRKWRQEEFREKCVVALRALSCLLSLIAAIVMATNQHGDWKEFDHYQEYRYVVAIGMLAFLYTALQLVRFGSGREFVPTRFSAIVDFAGDQIIAYLLISALSAAIPLTNRMREGADNSFTDASAASISMAFFAFVAIAISAMVSGFKLSRQTYI